MKKVDLKLCTSLNNKGGVNTMELVFDLEKSLDKAKLVQVQITVNGKNGTFQRMQWKNPADVKSTDKVIGNQAVLDAYRKSVAQQAANLTSASSKFDLSKWTAFKVANDRVGAMNYAKQCGVTWKEDASNPGINWMRACMAINKVSGNTVTAKASSSSTAPAMSTAKKLNTDGITGFDAMDKKDKMKALLSGGRNTRDDLIDYAKSVGLTWATTDKNGNPLPDGIAWMRCSMALQEYFEKKYGTTSASTSDSSTSSNKKAKEEAPKPVSDKIDITPDMTMRQVNLATIINGITDEAELELIKSSHVVAEDDKARSYIKDTFYKAYQDWKSGNAARGNGSYRDDYSTTTFSKNSANTVGGIFKGVAKKITKRGIEKLCEGGWDSVNIVSMAYPRDVMAATAGTGRYRWNDVANVTYDDVGGTGSYPTFTQMLVGLDEFSTFATDTDLSPNGYFSHPGSVVKPEYSDTSKHGFVQVLDRIAEGDPTTKTEVERVKKCYTDMIAACDGNLSLMYKMLNSGTYESMVKDVDEYKRKIDAYKLYTDCFAGIAKKYHLSYDDLEKLRQNIYRSNDYTIYKDGQPVVDRTTGSNAMFDPFSFESKFRAKWNVGLKDVINLYYGDEAGRVMTSLASSGTSVDDFISNPSKVIDDAVNEPNHPVRNYVFNDLVRSMDEVNASKDVTEDKYCKVKRILMDMYQQKAMSKDTSDSNAVWKDVDTSNWTAKDWDSFGSGSNQDNRYIKYGCAKDGDNDELDTVLANIHYIMANKAMLSEVSGNIIYGSTLSAANDQGNDYDGNFTYMRGINIGANEGRLYGRGYSKKAYTAAEINDRIKEQLKYAPIITTARRKQLAEFTEREGKYYTSSYNTPPAAGTIADKMKKASSYSMRSESEIDGFKGTPLHDIYTEQLQCMARYCPQMTNTRTNTVDKLFKQVSEKLGNTPYNPPVVDDPNAPTAVSDEKSARLKRLRTEALSAANCSLASTTDTENAAIETRVKHDWDKSSFHTQKKYHQGSNRIYSHIKAVFSGSYKINNSGNQERFEAIQQKTGETAVSLFHGTNRSGACGITCVDNKFSWTISGAKTAGRMLGDGVYLADLVGKSAGYFGNWGSGYNANGCLLICDVLLGKEYVSTSHSDAKSHNKVGSVDTVSMQAGTAMNGMGSGSLRADEWCVNKADRVSPRYIVDMRAERR